MKEAFTGLAEALGAFNQAIRVEYAREECLAFYNTDDGTVSRETAECIADEYDVAVGDWRR